MKQHRDPMKLSPLTSLYLRKCHEALQQSQDNNNDSDNDQDSEGGFKHMNAIPDTTEELTFKPRKVGVSKVEAWNGNQVALETPKGRGNADTSYSLYTEQEARDLANALYSASNYLRSQK